MCLKMSNAGAKLAMAVDAGYIYCELCEANVDMSGVSGYDEARERALDHAERQHE
ncbi:hypothetical protein HBNXHx_1756 [Haloferax volcanii]|nr:hypothetical protein HBNXHx_1756 [Haloferax alexandrinus]